MMTLALYRLGYRRDDYNSSKRALQPLRALLMGGVGTGEGAGHMYRSLKECQLNGESEVRLTTRGPEVGDLTARRARLVVGVQLTQHPCKRRRQRVAPYQKG